MFWGVIFTFKKLFVLTCCVEVETYCKGTLLDHSMTFKSTKGCEWTGAEGI